MASDLSAIERIVGLLECGEERGSAFLLKKNLIATCRHCIGPHLDEGAEIRFHLGNASILAELCEPDIPESHDAVFLRLAESVEDAKLVPLMASHMPRGLLWETFGYPAGRGRQGTIIGGSVSRSLNDEMIPRDVDLQCEGSDLPKTFRGLSGSPLVIDNAIHGMIQIRLDGGIGAISFARLRSYLAAAKVRLRAINDHGYLPRGLARELKVSIPNWRTFNRLEEELTENREGYLLLAGHPGAGKTLISAGFQPTSSELVVVGRYFGAGHAGSELPPSYHRHLGTFAKWLSVEASFRSGAAVAVPLDAPVGELAKSIAKNLKAIGAEFVGRGLVGILVIDGAEASSSDSQPCFLDYLPPAPPPGLAVVLTTSDADSLIRKYGQLSDSRRLHTLPLPLTDCERLVTRKLGENVPFSQITRIAELSEGNPLALSYYVREIRAARERGESDPWVAAKGGLDEYYLGVWNRFTNDPPAQYLLALMARMRGAITKEELFTIIPASQKVESVDSFRMLRYLFRGTEEGIRFYHESFRDFVLSHTSNLHTEIHTTISDYCATASDSDYATSNLLYHHARSSAGGHVTSSLCTQAWFDNAAIRCAHPELLLSDLGEALRERLEAGDALESSRLLLLRGRLSYRYNNVFAVHAAQFARAAVILRSPVQALRFIVREGHLICSIDDALSILRSLVLGDHVIQAEQLYRELRARFWAACEAGVAGYLHVVHQMVATYILALSGIETHQSLVLELRFLDRLLSENLEANGVSESEQEQFLAYAHGMFGGESLWSRGFTVPTDPDAYELALTLETAQKLARTHGYVGHRHVRPVMPSPFRALDRRDVAEDLRKAASSEDLSGEVAKLVAIALMRSSDAFALVRSLFLKSASLVTEVSLRASNGVDTDFDSLKLLQEAHEVLGYTEDVAVTARISRAPRHSWEERFFDAIAWLGQTNGQLYRTRALNETATDSFVERFKAELLPLISFTLAERSEWEDAYHLPENIMPELLAFAATIVAEHEPSSVSVFADLIVEHGERQFGLYNEGYTRLLTSVADVLGAVPDGTVAAADLRRAMYRFVSRNVFARRERVAGLLDCAQHLGRLGSTEAAEAAFQDAIDSSLGPNWYKEDQFGLIVDAMECVGDPSFTLTEWKGAVEILAYASGETTFQRYVRDAKGALIGHLAGSGLLAEALATYRHYLLPSYDIQKQRIKSVEVDTTSGLYGSRFGVQEVDEQRAALEMLKGLGDASPVKKWAVLELFWPWGDDRDGDRFARILSALLATNESDLIGERFLRLLRVEVSPERRKNFVHEIIGEDHSNSVGAWIAKAAELGIIEGSSSDDLANHADDVSPPDTPPGAKSSESDELYFPGVFGRSKGLEGLREALVQARKRIERGDMEAARTLLCDGLRSAQQNGWNIWQGVEEAREARDALLSETGPIEEGLKSLAPLILAEEHEGDWRIAEKLMATVMPHLDASRRQTLFSFVSEHVGHLVKAERKAYSVAGELEGLVAPTAKTPAECVDAWLISLLDHPNCHMRDRVAILLEWMCGLSEVAVEPLVDRIASGAIGHGREIAIGIVHRLVTLKPDLAEQIASLSQFEALRNDPSFLVRFLVEDVLGKTSNASSSVPPSIGMVSSATDQSALSFDADELLELEEGSETKARGWLLSLAGSHSVAELRELSDIRRRAYGGPTRHDGNAFEREAVFRALRDVRDEVKRKKILEASLWNPWWPDSDIRLDSSFLIPSIISRIESAEIGSAFNSGDQTVLHCFEFKPPERDAPSLWREVVAVLVCKEVFDKLPAPKNLWQSVSVFDKEAPPYTASILAMPTDYAIARFDKGFRVGGNFTPALPSQRLVQLVGSEGFDRTCWNDGRRWDLWGPGPVRSRGTALLCRTSLLSALKDYDLLWMVFSDDTLEYAVHQRKGLLYRRDDEYREDE